MSRPRWADEYFVKRFFRIAPLYYCLMAGMILWPAVKSGAWSVDFQALLLNLTFTFGFAPWKGIVWAGWSVGVEMLFYAIFPVLLMTVRTRIGTMVLLAISILVAYAARAALDIHYEHTVSLYRYNWAYFSFAANLCFFAMGMYAFRVAHTIDINSAAIRWVYSRRSCSANRGPAANRCRQAAQAALESGPHRLGTGLCRSQRLAEHMAEPLERKQGLRIYRRTELQHLPASSCCHSFAQVADSVRLRHAHASPRRLCLLRLRRAHAAPSIDSFRGNLQAGRASFHPAGPEDQR